MRSLLRRTAVAICSPLASTRPFQRTYHRSKEKLLPSRDIGVSYGLNWALAGRGIVVKDKIFYNLDILDLQKGGGTTTEPFSGAPLYCRGNVVGGVPDISRAQFAKLLKLVTFHLSSMSSLYVQDGAVGSSSKCDAKVRLISDNPSAVMLLSNVLWKISGRAISHDTCPLTIYVASSISTNVRNVLASGTQSANGVAAADIERSSLVLCGRAFADSTTVKVALAALATPILSARGGLPVPGRLLSFGGSTIMLFAFEEVIQCCSEIRKALVSTDSGIVISSEGSALLFQTKARVANPCKKLAATIIVASDSTGVLPSVSKLSPGQAAYHFLAGYQDGKFVPAYDKGPAPIDPLALANSLLSHLKEDNAPTFLMNAKSSGKYICGMDFIKLMELALSNNLPDNKLNDVKAGELKGKYKSFLSGKFPHGLPKEFSF